MATMMNESLSSSSAASASTSASEINPNANITHVEPRPSVLVAMAAGQAISLIGLVIAGALILGGGIAMIENRSHVSFRRAKSRAPIWLLAISVTGFYVLLTCLLMWWVNWTGNEKGCQDLVAPVLPLSYITMKQCLYLFLYDRAKVVHDALKINGTCVRALRWTVYLLSTMGVPFLTWWAFFLYWRGKVLPEGICVEYAVSIDGIIAVAAMDSFLSLALLGLFLAPVSRHVTRVRDDDLSPIFRRLIRRNLIVSCVMVVATLALLIAMTVELSVAFGRTPDPSLEYLQLWATIFPMSDTVITVLLPHILSGTWVPSFLRKYIVARATHPHHGFRHRLRSSVASVTKQQVADDGEPKVENGIAVRQQCNNHHLVHNFDESMMPPQSLSHGSRHEVVAQQDV